MAETTQQPQPVAHTIVHTELGSSDPGASAAFLGKIFGWTFEEMPSPNGPYHIMSGPAGSIGGIRGLAPEEPGPVVVNYVLVENIEAAVKNVESNGGKITVPVSEIEGMGKMAWFQEPGGCTMALWQDTSAK